MLNVAVAADRVRIPLSAGRVRAVAERVLRAEGVGEALVSIAFVSPQAIARLNRTHLGHAGPTDVIAFAFAPAPARPGPRRSPRGTSAVLGDVYIAPAVARQNAERWGVGVRQELARLVVHGLLHVIGYVHPEGDNRVASPMWQRQEALIRKLGALAR
jgi:probable rRNA maturation factor